MASRPEVREEVLIKEVTAGVSTALGHGKIGFEERDIVVSSRAKQERSKVS